MMLRPILVVAMLVVNEYSSLKSMQESNKTFIMHKNNLNSHQWFLESRSKEKPLPYYNFDKRDIDIAAILRDLSTNANRRTGIARPKFATTPNLKALFFGRCYEYQFQKRDKHIKWDCVKIWEAFMKAFTYKEPCDVNSEDYRPMLEMLNEDIPINKGLLWSGTRELAHQLSDFRYAKRFVTLEDTLAGYILNKLSWCGSVENPGMNFSMCPWKCSIQSSYWSLANEKFAHNLKGVVHILLNGTRQHVDDKVIYPSYMKDRYYLGPDVIPALRKDRITKINIIVAHTMYRHPLESCGEKSILDLITELQRKQIPVQCFNDINAVRHILCLDEPNNAACQLKNAMR